MLNKAILVGRMTADPELKHTPSNVEVVSFTVACNRSYADKSGERQADFINCVAWRKTAAFVCQYFRKGNAIGIDGSIQTRSYTDKEGKKRTAVEVLAEHVCFVESKAQGQASPAPQPPQNTTSQTSQTDFEEWEDFPDDDLPF